MPKTLFVLRAVYLLLCLSGSYLFWYANPDLQQEYSGTIFFLGLSIGVLTILIDIMLKGFSIRGLTALSLGLMLGTLISLLISNSPLFEYGEPTVVFLARLVLFLVTTYLCTMIALRGKEDLNLIIPYVRFVPENAETAIVIIDSSILVDGRIIALCESKFFVYAIVVPEFIVEELYLLAESSNPQKKKKGLKGIDSLTALKQLEYIDLRIKEFDVESDEKNDTKLVYVAQSLQAKILSLDYNLTKLAQLQNVECLNYANLTKILSMEVVPGDEVNLEVVKVGKDPTQGVGYLSDGSMVVVSEGASLVGDTVEVSIDSIIPSSGGKMLFAHRIKK